MNNNILLSQIASLTKRSFSQSVIETWCDNLSLQLPKADYSQFKSYEQDMMEFLRQIKPLCKDNTTLITTLYQFLNILLFNISSNFERIKRLIEDTLIESTASGQFNQTDIIKKIKVIEENAVRFLNTVVRHSYFYQIITEFREADRVKMPQLSALVETLKFFVEKYGLDGGFLKEIMKSIEHLVCQSKIDSKVVSMCNEVIFEANSLYQMVTHSESHHFSIIMLLQANFVENKREIFKNTQTGQAVLQSLLDMMIQQSKIDLIFSESYASTIDHQFISRYMAFKFLPTYLEFCQIFNKIKNYPTSQEIYKHNRPVFQEITKFLQKIRVSKLANFLTIVRGSLVKRFSQQESQQLLKLLLLNRFLLNPELKILYDRQNFNAKTYANISNRIKDLFFPTKLQEIKQISEFSQQLFQTYRSLIDCFNMATEKKRHIYINDQVLYIHYENLYETAKSFKAILQTPVISTVEKHQASIGQPSVRFLINDMENASERVNRKIRLDSSMSEEPLDDMEIINYLETLRIEQNQKQKHKQTYLESVRKNKKQLATEFDRVSQDFNEKMQEIVSSRVSYELYTSK